MVTRCFSYLRTSGDDAANEKAGIDVQRAAVAALSDFQIGREFVDDGVTGKIPMHVRPAGKQLIAALLANGIKHVLCYDGKRIGRTQPAFWSFIGMCRDNGIVVLDKDRVNLCESVQGGIQGLMAEMDHASTVARLQAGKARWRKERRVEGRWPYGEHPARQYDAERGIVARICDMHAAGRSSYAIAQRLNTEGITTRYGKRFTTTGIQRILLRRSEL